MTKAPKVKKREKKRKKELTKRDKSDIIIKHSTRGRKAKSLEKK